MASGPFSDSIARTVKPQFTNEYNPIQSFFLNFKILSIVTVGARQPAGPEFSRCAIVASSLYGAFGLRRTLRQDFARPDV